MKTIYHFIFLSSLCSFLPISASVSEAEYQEKLDRKFREERLEREAHREFEAGVASESALLDRLAAKELSCVASTGDSTEYVTSHTGAWHFPIATGDIVMLEDTSGWSISPEDAFKTLTWYANDTIIITPAMFYSWYDYVLINCRSGDRCEATLKDTPRVFTPYTIWINEINRDKGFIRLSDQTVWETSWFSGRTIANWSAGQKVIVGVNDNLFSTWYKNLLINEDRKESIKAQCLY